MNLNEKHIELLTKVQEIIMAGPYSDDNKNRLKSYICWCVLIVNLGEEEVFRHRHDFSLEDYVALSSVESQQIIAAIELALAGTGCMSNYLAQVFRSDNLSDLRSRIKADKFAHLARECWVARMIETKVIA